MLVRAARKPQIVHSFGRWETLWGVSHVGCLALSLLRAWSSEAQGKQVETEECQPASCGRDGAMGACLGMAPPVGSLTLCTFHPLLERRIPGNLILVEGCQAWKTGRARETLPKDVSLVQIRKGEPRGPGCAGSRPHRRELGANPEKAAGRRVLGALPRPGLQGHGGTVQHTLGLQKAVSRETSAQVEMRRWT